MPSPKATRNGFGSVARGRAAEAFVGGAGIWKPWLQREQAD
jgi:hypothetical protein